MTGETDVRGERSVPAKLCPPQIPFGLAWN